MFVQFDNVFDHAVGPGLGCVRHIEADDIHAGLMHLGDHFVGTSGGTQGADNFSFSHVLTARKLSARSIPKSLEQVSRHVTYLPVLMRFSLEREQIR